MERAFKGIWIPKEIWLDKNLNWVEKVLLVEINSLDNEDGCFATNAYFADFFGLSKDRISNLISQLAEKGYISVEMRYKPNSKQIDKRIVKSNYTYRRKHLEGIGESTDTPIGENAKDNNTSFNNTSNKNHIVEQIPFSKIINYLNDKTGKRYKVTQKWKDLIKARWNEGQRLDDFAKVIDAKSEQWLNDEKMNQYLRPQTLFGNKFDEYLNEFKPKQSINQQVNKSISETERRILELEGKL